MNAVEFKVCFKRSIISELAFLVLLSVTSEACGSQSQLLAYDLRSSDRSNPAGITEKNPKLSWKLASQVRGDAQTAWRVVASSSRELMDKDQGDLWDSGKVSSPVCSVTYSGKPIGTGERVHWKVKVWDARGDDGAWSPRAEWIAGVMNPSDWGKAGWITAPLASGDPAFPGNGCSLCLTREVIVKPGLARAVLHLTGLGQYTLEVNGEEASPGLLTPGWTDTSKTIPYDTIELGDRLHEGTNTLKVTLGGGMYRNPPSDRYAKFTTDSRSLKLYGMMDLTYADGSGDKVVTDKSWLCEPSPVTYCSIYGGEDRDARIGSVKDKDNPRPGAALLTGEFVPAGILTGASGSAPHIREEGVLLPVSTNFLSSNSMVMDLGQNASLMPRITVRGEAGSHVRITPSELIDAKGDIDDTATHGKSFCTYTLRGGGAETWRPDFYYRGARYLRIDLMSSEGGSVLPTVDSVEGVVIRSSSAPVGRFACSNELFNRIHSLVRWAQRGNMMSLLTDCPHREKLGWLEQDHLNGPALRYNFDLGTLFAKVCGDMSDAQTPEGLVPDVAPEFCRFSGGFRDSPEWGSACVLVPWQQYQFTGDAALLEKGYGSMTRYVDYLAGHAKDGIVDYGLGDWYDLGPKNPGKAQLTPCALTATAFLWQDADVLAKTAGLLGRKEDAAKYSDLALRTKVAFQTRFFDPATANYATGSQCANAIPLAMGLVPPEKRGTVLENLVKDVQAKGLTAGDVGYRYLLLALADGERSDVVYAMNEGSEKPGYGMQLRKGATSLTEAWDAGRGSSQNHFMLGQINEWFFRSLAGIRVDDCHPGFGHILIKPTPVGDLSWAGADYDSVRGLISSWWRRDGRKFTLDVSVPPGCTATVELPASDPKSVTESRLSFAVQQGITGIECIAGKVPIHISSGTYRFQCKLLPSTPSHQ